MENEFVTYEQALALKELGFNEACICYYDIEDSYKLKPTPMKEEVNAFHFNSTSIMVAAPLKQQALRWFREKYNMLACVYSNASGFLYEYHDTIGGTHRFDSGFTGDCEYSGAFTSYEKAENACIDTLISIAKQQNVSQAEYDFIQSGS